MELVWENRINWGLDKSGNKEKKELSDGERVRDSQGSRHNLSKSNNKWERTETR